MLRHFGKCRFEKKPILISLLFGAISFLIVLAIFFLFFLWLFSTRETTMDINLFGAGYVTLLLAIYLTIISNGIEAVIFGEGLQQTIGAGAHIIPVSVMVKNSDKDAAEKLINE